MTTVPEAYYQFIMDHAPYAYVSPPDIPDTEQGRTAFAAAFAIDFLTEAYESRQFEDRRAEIISKVTALADFILTQQSGSEAQLSFGGFRSSENSTYYYSVDACRVIPALLKAHKLTANGQYLSSAVHAGSVFLYNMQQKPAQEGIHDKYYGGFARAVTENDAWLREMDIECLYGLIGLRMLSEEDAENNARYESMMKDSVGFLRQGLDNFYLYYDPAPDGDGDWHRTGAKETEVYDDAIAYSLLGLYDHEGWDGTVRRVYSLANSIGACARHPGYDPSICWSGYIDVVNRSSACDYYDGVTCGILSQLRRGHDKPSYGFSMDAVRRHQSEFMFWGVKHADYSPVENKQATVTVSWLSRFFLNFEGPSTRFTQILNARGEHVTLFPTRGTSEKPGYGEAVDSRAIVSPTRADETVMEPGYVSSDYVTAYLFTPVRAHDRMRRMGADYEVTSVQALCLGTEASHYKVTCRRLISQ